MRISNIVSTVGLAKVASGIYAGNKTADRAVAHGLGKTPKLVIIQETYADHYGFVIVGEYELQIIGGDYLNKLACKAMDVTNFYVGNIADWAVSLNDEYCDYYWTAIG